MFYSEKLLSANLPVPLDDEPSKNSALLKEIILKKIIDNNDVEEVEKLTEIILQIDREKENVKENSEHLLKKAQSRKVTLIKQYSQIVSGFVLFGLGAYTFYSSDSYVGCSLLGAGLANLGSPIKTIQSLLFRSRED